MNCINCGDELFPIMNSETQFAGALDVQVHLGYGEFADQEPDGEASPRGYFCKLCASTLCGFFPGFRKLTGTAEVKEIPLRRNVFDQDQN